MYWRGLTFGMGLIINTSTVERRVITLFGIVEYLTTPNTKFLDFYYPISDSGSRNTKPTVIDLMELHRCSTSIMEKRMGLQVIIMSISTISSISMQLLI